MEELMGVHSPIRLDLVRSCCHQHCSLQQLCNVDLGWKRNTCHINYTNSRSPLTDVHHLIHRTLSDISHTCRNMRCEGVHSVAPW